MKLESAWNIIRAGVMACALIAIFQPAGARAQITDGLVGLWTFDGGTEDLSGNDNHGTLEGGASLDADVPAELAGGESLSLTGGGQHVLVPHDATLDITGALTVSAWVKRPETGWGAILAKSPSAGSNPNFPGNYELRLGNGDGVQTLLWEDGNAINTAPSIVDTGNSVPADTWTHIAITGTNSGAYSFYINGVETGSGTTPATFLTSQNDSPLYLGSRGDFFTTINGKLDEVGLWNRSLSAAEIAALASGPVFNGPSIGLSPREFSSTVSEGEMIGTLTSIDPANPGDTYTYALVAGDGDTDNAKFQIAGDEVLAGSHDFSTAADGQEYTIRVLSTGAPSGTEVEAELILTAVAPDLDAPLITDLSPANNSVTARVGDNLVATFDEAIAIGNGNITIKNLSDATQTVIPVDDAQITVTGSAGMELTIDLSSDLLAEKSYAVQIDATAIDDLAGNSFAGIDDDSTWSFTIPPTPPTALVGYWPFDADTDPQPDLSQFANNAAVDGAASWGSDASRDSGVMQLAASVGMQAAHSDSLNIEGAITIAAWVKPTGVEWEGIVAKSPGTSSAQNFPGNYELRLNSAGRHMEFLWEDSNGGLGTVADAGTAISDNIWTHVAIAATPGGTFAFYVNGVATTTGAMPDNFGGQNTNPLYIGSRADAFTGFDGCLDDVAIFAGQVTAQQISAIMDGDFSEFGIGSDNFRITAVSKGETLVDDERVPSVTLTFNSLPNKNYKIEASTSLKIAETPGGWIELNDSFPSQGESTIYVDTQFAGVGSRLFYRVSEN